MEVTLFKMTFGFCFPSKIRKPTAFLLCFRRNLDLFGQLLQPSVWMSIKTMLWGNASMRVPLFTICEHMGYSRLYVVFQSKARETLLSLFYIPISLLPPISIDFHFLIHVCIGQRGDKRSIGKLKTSPPKPLCQEKEDNIWHDPINQW